ncbi:MAG: histidine phosphatase family protein [Lachnospiraceae bacterium]|nr:histidine phosphatase family protein [Lachnospiraceae bacterium]
MQIYLVRHGRQSSPLCNVNVDLAPEGVEQAKRLAKRLTRLETIDAVYASALLRAEQTAEILADGLGVSADTGHAELNEIDFGELTGHSDAEIAELYGDFMKQRAAMTEDIPFPGGECGKEVWERAYPFLQKLVKSGAERVVVVTHGGVIRSLVAGILKMEQKHKLKIVKSLENTSITELKYNQASDEFTVERINDYAHLEETPHLLRKYFH